MADVNENKVHILIVDDDPLLRRLFGGKLSAAGYEVVYASNGSDGREVARRLMPDLILMDINMPGFEDGLDTTHRMKNEDETKDIPIVMLSNVDMSLDAEKKVKEMGAIGFIHKSIEMSEFAEKVKQYLALNSQKSVSAAEEETVENKAKPAAKSAKTLKTVKKSKK